MLSKEVSKSYLFCLQFGNPIDLLRSNHFLHECTPPTTSSACSNKGVTHRLCHNYIESRLQPCPYRDAADRLCPIALIVLIAFCHNYNSLDCNPVRTGVRPVFCLVAPGRTLIQLGCDKLIMFRLSCALVALPFKRRLHLILSAFLGDMLIL
jgi:hypothetical protein